MTPKFLLIVETTYAMWLCHFKFSSTYEYISKYLTVVFLSTLVFWRIMFSSLTFPSEKILQDWCENPDHPAGLCRVPVRNRAGFPNPARHPAGCPARHPEGQGVQHGTLQGVLHGSLQGVLHGILQGRVSCTAPCRVSCTAPCRVFCTVFSGCPARHRARWPTWCPAQWPPRPCTVSCMVYCRLSCTVSCRPQGVPHGLLHSILHGFLQGILYVFLQGILYGILQGILYDILQDAFCTASCRISCRLQGIQRGVLVKRFCETAQYSPSVL